MYIIWNIFIFFDKIWYFPIFTFFYNRATGDYSYEYWTMIICNALVPQLFWFKKIRRNLTAAFIISIIINIGMWFERYNIIISSLAKDFLPSSWVTYSPTWVEIGVFAGTLGLFGTGVLLFFKFIPMMAISELKGVLKVTSYNTNDKKHISHE